MEVHRHSHHPKKFKEYITEFLMLFLAVSLGFFAENIREHQVEKERAHELIIELKADIHKNIQLIDSVVLRDRLMLNKFDSAMVYLVSHNEVDGDSLYNNLPNNIIRFLSKNDTYEQMKSSGSLRYIKNPLLLERILNYSNDCQAAETRSTSMEADFVSGIYTNQLNKWMPQSVAISRYVKDRNGSSNLIGKEHLSLALTSKNDTAIFLKPLAQFSKRIIYKGEQLEKLKDELFPIIVRRTILLTNTVRFMGLAKQSGITLLNDIDKQEN
jgi:hypothetical protein